MLSNKLYGGQGTKSSSSSSADSAEDLPETVEPNVRHLGDMSDIKPAELSKANSSDPTQKPPRPVESESESDADIGAMKAKFNQLLSNFDHERTS